MRKGMGEGLVEGAGVTLTSPEGEWCRGKATSERARLWSEPSSFEGLRGRFMVACDVKSWSASSNI